MRQARSRTSFYRAVAYMTISTEDYVRIVDTIPQPAFLADREGVIYHANEPFLELSGRTSEQESRRTLFGLGIFNNPAEYRGFLRSFRDSWAPRQVLIRGSKERAQSRQLFLRATLVGPSQAPDRQLLLGALRINQSTGVLESISTLSNTHLMYAVITEDLRVLEVSRLLRRELGYSPAVPIRHLRQLDATYSPEREEELMAQLARGGRPSYTSAAQRTNNTQLPCQFDFSRLPPPPAAAQILHLVTITDLSELEELKTEQQKLAARLKQLDQSSLLSTVGDKGKATPPLVTASPAQQQLLESIRRVAPTDVSVLIQGETGTGKELIARTIHAYSRRAARPLVTVNCGALPAELIESELFGYRKGAFTGATVNRPGLFEQAHGGTIFLDEIGELPLAMQTRLLRVLQEGTIDPLGATKTMWVDVRVIAATNQDLAAAVRAGTFRSDLYFRLNVVPLRSIPLRDRPEDIPVLVEEFIRKYAGLGDGGRLPQLSEAELRRLHHYSFPGNVRELENIVQRALVNRSGDELQFGPLPEQFTERGTATVGVFDDTTSSSESETFVSMEELQRRYITHVLHTVGGKVSGAGGAAEILKMNPQTLFSRMRKLGISR